MKRIRKPEQSEYAVYYDQYIQLVDNNLPILKQLQEQQKEILEVLKSLSHEQSLWRYAEDKWNIRDIIQHLIDCERVFVYRAMRFARQDKTPLPFFDENQWAKEANASHIPLTKLLNEYKALRKCTILFFDHLPAAMHKRNGWASQAVMSVRACAWIICGHEKHHWQVIRERYLAAKEYS